MRYYFLFIFVLFTILGCNNNDERDIDITVDAQLALDLLNNASDTLIIAGRNYILEAFMWRDFMPGDNDDHSLTSLNHLVALDSLSMPSYLDLTKQYVILNDSIWTTDYTDQRDTIYDYKLSRVSREGPEWGINKIVSVVAEVTNTAADTTCFIKVEDIIIIATF